MSQLVHHTFVSVLKLNFLSSIALYWFISGSLNSDEGQRPSFDEILVDFKSNRKNVLSNIAIFGISVKSEACSLNPSVEFLRKSFSKLLSGFVFYNLSKVNYWTMNGPFNLR